MRLRVPPALVRPGHRQGVARATQVVSRVDARAPPRRWLRLLRVCKQDDMDCAFRRLPILLGLAQRLQSPWSRMALCNGRIPGFHTPTPATHSPIGVRHPDCPSVHPQVRRGVAGLLADAERMTTDPRPGAEGANGTPIAKRCLIDQAGNRRTSEGGCALHVNESAPGSTPSTVCSGPAVPYL